MPDGLKVDRQGNVYATMPGGVWVIAPDGRHLGTIRAPEAAANCGWGDDAGPCPSPPKRASIASGWTPPGSDAAI